MVVLLLIYISWEITALIHSNYGFHLEFLISADLFARLTYIAQVNAQTEPTSGPRRYRCG